MWHCSDQWEGEKSLEKCGSSAISLCLQLSITINVFVIRHETVDRFILLEKVLYLSTELMMIWYISSISSPTWPGWEEWSLDDEEGSAAIWDTDVGWWIHSDVSQGNGQFLFTVTDCSPQITWTISNTRSLFYCSLTQFQPSDRNIFWFRKFPAMAGTAGGWNDFLGLGRTLCEGWRWESEILVWDGQSWLYYFSLIVRVECLEGLHLPPHLRATSRVKMRHWSTCWSESRRLESHTNRTISWSVKVLSCLLSTEWKACFDQITCGCGDVRERGEHQQLGVRWVLCWVRREQVCPR